MYSVIKSILDFLFATLLLVVLLPFLVVVALLQLFFVKKPLFIQKRPGRNGLIFKMIKFRTLRVDGVDNSSTALGRLLRLTSVDELPQLINVLKGEMSFIGPRPLLVEYLEFYNPRQRKRHEVKPGITGLAQVKGRNKLSWLASLELDVQYVENFSLKQDMKILFLTVSQLFKFSEVKGKGGEGRSKFNGN